MKLPKFLPLILLLLTLGCTYIITPEKSTTTYILKADKRIEMETIIEGPLANLTNVSLLTPTFEIDIEAWEEDCTAEMQRIFTAFRSTAEFGMNRTQRELFSRIFELTFARFTCEFGREDDRGIFKSNYFISKEELDELKNLSLQMGAEETPGPKLRMIENEDGSLTVEIPVKNVTILGPPAERALELKEEKVRILVEGEVIEITSGYVKEGGYYVYENPSKLGIEKVVVRYRPRATSIVAHIIDAILGFFNAIINFFKGIFGMQ